MGRNKMQYAGEIRLSFINRGGRTVADRTYRRGNSRISANIPVTGNIPYYFLISTGGGYTEGEQYLQEIELKNDTHAILTTQTPNYIFKCEHGRKTRQENIITVGDGADLEYYIDETIPYAKALFEQDTEVRLGEGASLILTDGLTSGWSRDEEPFKYGEVCLHTRIFRDEELLINDCLLVDPREDAMREIGYFEECAAFNSAVIIDERITARVIEEMRNNLFGLETSSRYGISLLEKGGAALRVLGESAYKNNAVVRCWIKHYRERIRHFEPVNLRKRTD